MIPIKEGRLRSVYAIEAEDTEIPDGALVVGKNGQFEVSSSPVFSFIKPINKDSTLSLKHITPGFSVKRHIPWDEFWPGAQWLRNQWDKHCQGKGKHASKEFILLLFYNEVSEKYFWHPPKQDGTSAHVDYTTSDDEDIVKLVADGNLIVGTMHNHFGKGTAFQSGTDHKDEAKHGIPMIHFTMGWMDAPHIHMSEFDVRFVAGEGFNKKLEFSDVVADREEFDTPDDWDAKLSVKYKAPSRVTSVPSGNYGGYGSQFPSTLEDYAWWNSMNTSVSVQPHGDEVISMAELWEDVNELTSTKGVIRAGFKSGRVASLIKNYPSVAGIAHSSHMFMAKAIIDALFQDLKAMIMVEDSVAIETMDKEDMFEIITEIMAAASKADDVLGKFIRKQDELCAKKD